MTQPLVEFNYHDPSRFPHPYPASQLPPQWVRTMSDRGLPHGRQMLAAASAGFVVPLGYDCYFETDAKGNVSFRGVGVPISTQLPFQYRGSWFGHLAVIKFYNPWVMRTPPGYCTLVVPMLNRFNMPFEPLSGVVETDSYYLEIHFPTLCYMSPNQKVMIPRGTPLVQAIPVPREPWKSIIGELDSAAGLIQQTAL